METAFIGVQGHVVAVNKQSGQIVWQTKLGGGFGDSFVSLACDGDLVLAHTRGHLFALDCQTGAIRWDNKLPGLGYGTATICAHVCTADVQSALRHHEKRGSGS